MGLSLGFYMTCFCGKGEAVGIGESRAIIAVVAFIGIPIVLLIVDAIYQLRREKRGPDPVHP